MRWSHWSTSMFFGLLLVVSITWAGEASPANPPTKPVIQLAILLDTSGSMGGLINQARAQLWNVVNEFAKARRNDQSPELQIALYEYGNPRNPAANGYIRQVLPLTTDLDKVSEQLFALTINGGDEFCGQVIQKATLDLAWNAQPDALKTIFIAGNEPFSQGPVDYKAAITAAIAKGITVNTIYCGSANSGEANDWREGATLADGTSMCIDMNQATVAIATPMDAELLRMNGVLNSTYIPYGAYGAAGQMNQLAQDANAASLAPGAAASRANAKATMNYSNTSWDLVDAIQNNTVKLEEIKEADLPADMQKMTVAERQAHIEKQLAERKNIQAQIKETNAKRDAYLAEEAKKQGQPGTNTLGDAVVTAVHTQAMKQGYAF